MNRFLIPAAVLCLLLSGCQRDEPVPGPVPEPEAIEPVVADLPLSGPELLIGRQRLAIYHRVPLTADLSHLSDAQRDKLRLLIRASDIMDDLFWRQAFGDREELLDVIDNEAVRAFAEINYGPWDRLDGNRPFLAGFGDKPPGARFYPADLTREDFEAWNHPDKTNAYSVVRRDGYGNLELIPYHELFADELLEAADLLRQAADLAESEAFAEYLRLRAEALVTDDYQPSDFQWMEVRDNQVELVIGAIEHYEDALFGIRAAYESFVLIKDMEWSERLNRFARFLPDLQRGLPVADEYKAEQPGSDGDLNAYDAVYYAGDANAGAKTIAINLPNDERVQLEKGTRRLQIKNTMQAKFDHILVPIADLLIAEEQHQHITFDAFFANVMFHEVAHGLGIKHTITDGRPVREALQEHQAAIEEGKADVLGLYMIQQLSAMNEWEADLMDHYVTFLAGIFRSVRFGAASAHGRANMVAFNYFRQAGGFAYDADTGTYRVNREAFEQAVGNLARDILVLQGDGDYQTTGEFLGMFGNVGGQLQADLDRVSEAGIPVDIALEQGPALLGL